MNESGNRASIAAAEDERLVRAFQEGERIAFDHLVLKYQDRVFGLCYRFTGNREEANDCAQDAFVKVYRSLGRFRSESSFSTWLYRIAVNTCKNRLASAGFRHGRMAVSLDRPVSPDGHPGVREMTDGSPSPANEIERGEKSQIIQRAIDSLPEEQRMIVVLRDIEGLSYGEISQATGYNPGTVKSKLSRARHALKDKLKGRR